MAVKKRKVKKELHKKTATEPLVPLFLFALAILQLFLLVIPGEKMWRSSRELFLGIFGVCAIFLPVLFIYIAFLVTSISPAQGISRRIITAGALFWLASTEIFVFFQSKIFLSETYFKALSYAFAQGKLWRGAGVLGALLGALVCAFLGRAGAMVVVSLAILVVGMLLTDADLTKVFHMFSRLKNHLKESILKRVTNASFAQTNETPGEELLAKETVVNGGPESVKIFMKKKQSSSSKNEDFLIEQAKTSQKVGRYNFPLTNLLQKASVQNEAGESSELETSGHLLVETLRSFSVQTKIVDISRGPSVTRYELQPATGVKVSKITSLADDIALNLAAHAVRIEAPIPGKAAVGIEIPNKIVNVVRIRELLESYEFRNSESRLTVVLGKNLEGNAAVADLSRMPHLLIAGSTGAGKSVCINSFIVSLLYKALPDDVRLLMIDPKIVELGVYNGLPHLLVPVVTDPSKAAGALNWAVAEMLRRYKVFAEQGVRDIEAYKRHVSKTAETTENLEKLSQIVIIIDELADLMIVAPREIEDAICRLAQMARAAGMHLVIATQRPSVDVITGIIKANIPSRIALAVSSQIDSRTILDSGGAEKLLGRGDMLFAPVGASKPIRVQGCYVSDEEIAAVVDFVKSTQNGQYDETVMDQIESCTLLPKEKPGESQDEGVDELFAQAVRCVLDAGQASTSFLQRRFRVGYARAGRIIDEMEQKGIIGPPEGAKARPVLISHQQFAEMFCPDDV